MKHLYNDYDYICRALVDGKMCGLPKSDEVHNMPHEFKPQHSDTCRQCCAHCYWIENSAIHKQESKRKIMAKQATLKELVLGAVEGFLATDTPFSVYDVTQSIRQVVNSGAVEIPALYVDNQAFKFEISHDDVKFFFNELLINDSFSQPLSRSRNGAYFLYYGNKVPASVNPLGAMSSAFQGMGQALGKMAQVAKPVKPKSAARVVAQQAASSTKLPRTEVINRVRTYQTNCNYRGVTPTTKQIQSAIKRGNKSTGWTRSELKTIWQGISAGTI